MIETTIYYNAEGKARILSLYDELRTGLGVEFEDRTVGTRFGRTHVLVNGPEDGPPVVMLHGGNTVCPLGLRGLVPLLRTGKFRVYAPDTIGHPGRSAEIRLPASDLSYGVWMFDVLDGLGLETAAFVGGSFGAGIVLRLAAYAPERIGRAALFVPSGIVPVPFSSMVFRIGLPYFAYLLFGTPGMFRRSVAWMGADLGEDVLRLVEAVFRHVRIEAEMPRVTTAEELADFTAPVMIISAEKDAMFPGKKVVKRAGALFPNLVSAECLPGCTHFPSERDTDYINRRIAGFLEST